MGHLDPAQEFALIFVGRKPLSGSWETLNSSMAPHWIIGIPPPNRSLRSPLDFCNSHGESRWIPVNPNGYKGPQADSNTAQGHVQKLLSTEAWSLRQPASEILEGWLAGWFHSQSCSGWFFPMDGKIYGRMMENLVVSNPLKNMI